MRAWLAAAALAALAAGSGQTLAQQPARDTSARPPDAAPPATGRITGRVVDAANGRPMKLARVTLNAQGIGNRAVQTDEAGNFDFLELRPGRYTLLASKAGYISLAYGQRRPLQPGAPLQLEEGQQLKGIEFRMPRGSVIAGTVLDEIGDPMPGIQVRLLRLQYQRGSRMLVPAGGAAQTDDRGAYRIWGLNPGEYFVSATAPNFRGPGGRGAAVGGGRGRGAGADDGVDIGYAPTYFPGVPSVFEATPVAVGLSGEMLDVNFNLLLVRTAQITGRITNADGTPVTAGAVNLRPDAPGGIGAPSVTLGGRINWDGAFSIANVPPGRYVLTARGRDDVAPQYGWLPITVGGEDLAGVVLVLAPGATMSGIVSAQAVRSTTPPDLTQVRVTVQPADAGVFGGAPASRVQKDGTFTMSGIPTGPFLVRAQAPRGWTVKSIIVDGREVVDSPIDVRAGQKLAGASIVLSDRQTEINGVVADRQRTPVTDYTVLAFPADSALWTPWSRHIATVRPDQNGRYQFTTLPPGDYLMALIDPEQPGEWFDPRFLEAQRADAGRVTLADGDVKTHDFSIAP